MSLPSFDTRQPEYDWRRTRPAVGTPNPLLAHQQRRRRRLLVSGIAAALATIVIVAIAVWQGARLRELITQLEEKAAVYTSSRPVSERPFSTAAAKPVPKRRALRARAANPEPLRENAPKAADRAEMGDFAEVVDPNNRHYLVRYRPAPIVALPGERSQATNEAAAPAAYVANAALATSERDSYARPSSSISLRAFAPGSAGIVVLRGVVGKDGTVRDLKVLSGPPELAQSAKQAAQRWQYVPEYYNGLPIEREVQITVDFTVRLSE